MRGAGERQRDWGGKEGGAREMDLKRKKNMNSGGGEEGEEKFQE